MYTVTLRLRLSKSNYKVTLRLRAKTWVETNKKEKISFEEKLCSIPPMVKRGTSNLKFFIKRLSKHSYKVTHRLRLSKSNYKVTLRVFHKEAELSKSNYKVTLRLRAKTWVETNKKEKISFEEKLCSIPPMVKRGTSNLKFFIKRLSKHSYKVTHRLRLSKSNYKVTLRLRAKTWVETKEKERASFQAEAFVGNLCSVSVHC
ncbi:hypothetical protein K435DRAFT_806609 [Dendrothele bispora CBS 962.96]|uniref:Uncharacterized protein n=1 Tax=Dendrothele bispora (strain CBS 962.96) TaxID=1314807 RepID=A0A4S8L8L9_DENBC|nr:hypothetical protein K435DRAFT_806609 [Dendrothele bispora CBS 962.96]